jgi:uncharacterized protein (DUF2164 family)
MKDALQLSKEEKDLIIDKIIKYFYNESNEEIGNLAAELIYDFICEAIAPYFYNMGIKDSISFLNERVEDMYGLEKIL